MMDIPIHGSNGENGQSSDASSTASSGYVKISMDSEGGFVDGDSPTRTAAVVEATAGGPSGKDFDEFVFMSTSATTTGKRAGTSKAQYCTRYMATSSSWHKRDRVLLHSS